MPEPLTMSATGSVFLDPRGSQRALRVSWHTEHDVVVLSLWRDNLCSASFRLDAADVPALIELLASGLAEVTERDREDGAYEVGPEDTAERPVVGGVAVGTDTLPVARRL